nr:MAG TPA: hypothetical protein [Caudoviricetes sp.]
MTCLYQKRVRLALLSLVFTIGFRTYSVLISFFFIRNHFEQIITDKNS